MVNWELQSKTPPQSPEDRHIYCGGMETTRHRSLTERGGRKAFLETLQQPKKCQENPDIHESKEKIRAHRASSKATRLFLTKL